MIAGRKKRFSKGIGLFIRRLYRLVTQPIFIALTAIGNLLIVTSAYLVFKLEYGVNPKILEPLDTLWWAVSTVTTVGYGDITPITPAGKIIGIVLMIVGIAIFWSYTALFAEALISKEILDLEDELQSIDKVLRKISKSELQSSEELKKLVDSMQKQLHQLGKPD